MNRSSKILSTFLALLLVLSLSAGTFCAAAEEDLEEKAAKSSIESFLHNYARAAMLYEKVDLTAYTILAPGISFSEEAAERIYSFSGRNRTLAEMQENISYTGKKAAFFAGMRQMQAIYREKMETAYSYRSFEQNGDTASASVTEGVSFYYTDSDQLSVYETIYSVDLIKVEGRWLVAYVTDGGWCDGTYGKDPSAFAPEAALEELAEQLQTEDCTIRSPYDPEEVPDGAILYNGQNAAAYAYTYSRLDNESDRGTYYNKLFVNYAGQGGDCMNFTSQCLWAGFGGSQTTDAIRGHALPMDTEGENQWYGRSASGGKDASAWISCQSFRKYLTGTADATGTGGSNAGEDTGIYATILDAGMGSAFTGVTAEELVGAAAHVEGVGGPHAHAIILTAATGTKRSEVWYCSHTKEVRHVKLGDYYIAPIKVYIPRYLRTDAPQTDAIQMDMIPPAAPSADTAVGFHTAAPQAKLTLTITAPSGVVGLQATAFQTNLCSANYRFTEEGLYRIDCTAQREEDGEQQQACYFVRCRDLTRPAAPAAEEEAA